MAKGELSRDHRQWMAVYCRPRSEKKVADRLADRGVEVYCPLQTTLRQWSDRRKKVKVPVFPSYVFVHVAEAERLSVLQDPGVMNFVFWLGKPAVIREEEISAIRNFLAGHPDGEFELVSYRKGESVAIQAGPFSGYEATVEESGSRFALLSIDSIGLTIRVKAPLSHLRRSNH